MAMFALVTQFVLQLKMFFTATFRTYNTDLVFLFLKLLNTRSFIGIFFVKFDDIHYRFIIV